MTHNRDNSSNIKNISLNTAIMSVAVFLSRILGLVRDQVMAAFFGTSYVNDAFNIAFNIPNLLRRLFGEGALSSAFVPIYNEFGLKRGKKYQLYFALNMLSILTFVLLVLTFLGMLFAPWIVRLLYPGSGEETVLLAIRLCRLMYPYLFFIGLSSTFIAILNSHNVFFVTGLSSGLLNIGWVATIIFGSLILKKDSSDLIYFAAYGVILGGFLQTLINIPFLKRAGYVFKVILRFNNIAMKTLWKRFVPAMFGMGVREINLISSALIASFLPVGSISALGFANRLMQLPLGVFAISVGTAALPEYSRLVTEKKWDDLSKTVNFTFLLIMYILIPITIIMLIGSELFVRLLFERGEFGETAVQMTTKALIWYSVGLCFFGFNQVLTPIFFAFKDTKTPVFIGAYMVVLNILLSILLMQFMAHSGVAAATSITAMTNTLLLLYYIRKKLPDIKLSGIKKNIYKMKALIAMMSIALIVFVKYYIVVDFLALLVKFFLYLIFALLITVLGFHLLKPDHYKEITGKLYQRFKK